jgi:gliding motility-associated-like protein
MCIRDSTNTTNGTFDPATAGIGTHLITYIIPGSCADTSSISIVVNGVMDATITPAGPYCSNDAPVNLVAAMTGGSWSGPGITNASTGLFNPSISGSGSFNIIYAIAGSCGDADTVTIVVNPAHNASINPSGPYCVTDNPVFLSSFENGGVWAGAGITNASTGSFDPAQAGAGSHQIIYSISGTCGDADTITIVVNALANTAITSTGPYCDNIGVFDLTAATSGGIWSGAGITNTSTGSFNPIFAGVGTHTIIYLITGACGNSDTVSVTVLPSPTANAVGTDESCIGKLDGSATASGIGGTAPYSYLWETTATTASITGMAPGEYSVVVSDANGCFAADTALILGATTPCEVIVPVIYIPNIFTPNNDGNNDVLYVRGQGIDHFTLSIYDRWGEKVFETSELSIGWDGTFHNKHMDAGVFVWQLHAEFSDGTVKDDKGSITMTR